MPEKKEQKIVVFTGLTENDNYLILYGIKIASIFRKELCLFYNISGKKPGRDFILKKLEGYETVVRKEIPALKVSALVLSGNMEELIGRLSDKHEAILVVASTPDYKILSKAVRQSPVPFLFTSPGEKKIPEFKNIVIPVDLRKEMKDAALWGSYFGRFNNAGLKIIAAGDSSKESKRLVAKNVIGMKKLFTKLAIDFHLFKGTKSSFSIQFEALDSAKQTGADLLIILGSSVITPIDLLIGLPEKKVIKRAGSLPVMIINPRTDMYILCE